MKTLINTLNQLVTNELIPDFESKILALKSLPDDYQLHIKMHRYMLFEKGDNVEEFYLTQDVAIPADIPLFNSVKKKKHIFNFDNENSFDLARSLLAEYLEEDMNNLEILSFSENNSSYKCILEYEVESVDQPIDLLKTVYLSSSLKCAFKNFCDSLKSKAFDIDDQNERLVLVHGLLRELETILCKLTKDVKYHSKWIVEYADNFSYGRATDIGIAIQFINKAFRFLMNVFETEVWSSNTRMPLDILYSKYIQVKTRHLYIKKLLSKSDHLNGLNELLIDTLENLCPKTYRDAPSFYLYERILKLLSELESHFIDIESSPLGFNNSILESMVYFNLNSKPFFNYITDAIESELAKKTSLANKKEFLKYIVKVTKQSALFSLSPLSPMDENLDTVIYKWLGEELLLLNNMINDNTASYSKPAITINGKLQDVHVLIEFLMASGLFNDDDKSKLRNLFISNSILKSGPIERRSLNGAAGKPFTLKDRNRYENWIRRLNNIVQGL